MLSLNSLSKLGTFQLGIDRRIANVEPYYLCLLGYVHVKLILNIAPVSASVAHRDAKGKYLHSMRDHSYIPPKLHIWVGALS